MYKVHGLPFMLNHLDTSSRTLVESTNIQLCIEFCADAPLRRTTSHKTIIPNSTHSVDAPRRRTTPTKCYYVGLNLGSITHDSNYSCVGLCLKSHVYDMIMNLSTTTRVVMFLNLSCTLPFETVICNPCKHVFKMNTYITTRVMMVHNALIMQTRFNKFQFY